MIELRVSCKVHDSQERVVKVGVGTTQFTVAEVWSLIDSEKYRFYTDEKGRQATVKHMERNGRKYLTTHPDGFTDNNLDELPRCYEGKVNS